MNFDPRGLAVEHAGARSRVRLPPGTRLHGGRSRSAWLHISAGRNGCEMDGVPRSNCRSRLNLQAKSLSFHCVLHYMRRNIAPRRFVFTGPRWTTSRPWASQFLQFERIFPMSITPSARPRSIYGIRYQEGRHRLAGSPGRDPVRAYCEPHRALQGPQQGQPLPPWPAEDGLDAPPPPRLRQGEGRSALQGTDRALGLRR